MDTWYPPPKYAPGTGFVNALLGYRKYSYKFNGLICYLVVLSMFGTSLADTQRQQDDG